MTSRWLLGVTALALSSFNATLHAQTPAAVTTDTIPDKLHPASTESFQLPSHGALLNAFVYIASGAGPHKTVILLHGFPGNEKNLDLAQAVRRAGYNVLYFDYRGSWGSPGEFSFTHAIEDAQSAVAYLRDPANAAKLHSDPNQIVVMGHSMGGMITAYVTARDPTIKAAGLISAADMAGRTLPTVNSHQEKMALPQIASRLAAVGVAPLAGCTPEGLASELMANAAKWSLAAQSPGLGTPAGRPIFVATSDDGGAAAAEALVTNLRSAGDSHVTSIHLATDHSYSDHRIALEASILDWLATL